ncbi:MAG: hypothetical protein AB2804_04295 [Candidatus Thiodiazotropha endolucinida]
MMKLFIHGAIPDSTLTPWHAVDVETLLQRINGCEAGLPNENFLLYILIIAGVVTSLL